MTVTSGAVRTASTLQKYTAASTRGANRPPATEGSTSRWAGQPERPRNDRSAGSIPDRASWVGNTPRVRSRSASSAVFVPSTSRSMPGSGDPARTAARARRMSSGSAIRCGSTSRVMVSSSVRRAASPASMIRSRDSTS